MRSDTFIHDFEYHIKKILKDGSILDEFRAYYQNSKSTPNSKDTVDTTKNPMYFTQMNGLFAAH